jgi:hypothetical protein
VGLPLDQLKAKIAEYLKQGMGLTVLRAKVHIKIV